MLRIKAYVVNEENFGLFHDMEGMGLVGVSLSCKSLDDLQIAVKEYRERKVNEFIGHFPKQPSTTDKRASIIEALKAGPKRTRDLASELNRKTTHVSNMCSLMASDGILKKGPHKTWALNPDDPNAQAKEGDETLQDRVLRSLHHLNSGTIARIAEHAGVANSQASKALNNMRERHSWVKLMGEGRHMITDAGKKQAATLPAKKT